MKKIGCSVAMLCGLGMAGEGMAAENNSPLTQNVPVMIAQATRGQSDDARMRTLGVCLAVPNKIYSLSNVVGPVSDAGIYLDQFEHRKFDFNHPSGIATVLQLPEHGVLRLVTEADRGTLFSASSSSVDPSDPGYAYLPHSGYEGTDSAILLVDIGGIKIQVKYVFHAISGVLGNDGSDRYCTEGPFWKVSSTIDAKGNSTVASAEYRSPLASVGRNNQRTLCGMNLERQVQCAALIASSLADWFFQG